MEGRKYSYNQTVGNAERLEIFNRGNEIFVEVANNQDPVDCRMCDDFFNDEEENDEEIVDLSKNYNLKGKKPISPVGGVIDLTQQTSGSFTMVLNDYWGTDFMVRKPTGYNNNERIG